MATDNVCVNLSAADLVCRCNLLKINYETDNLFEHMYMNLHVSQLFCSKSVDDEDDAYDDDYDLENTIVQNNNK